jgi:hypothetical protein
VLEKIVPYEDFKLVAVAGSAAAPEVKTGESVREFTLTVFEGGREVVRDAQVMPPAPAMPSTELIDDTESIDE